MAERITKIVSKIKAFVTCPWFSQTYSRIIIMTAMRRGETVYETL